MRMNDHQSGMAGGIFISIFIVAISQQKENAARRSDLGVIFSPFLVSQAVKRETSPGTTGTTSEDERSKRT